MPLPTALTRINRRVTNPILGRFAGRVAPLALIEHRGRRSGRTFTTPVFAFEGLGEVTFALTYGPGVDWLANARAAGGAVLRHRGRTLRLGPPTVVPAADGLRRMPAAVRAVLRLTAVTDFVEMPIVAG